MGILQRWFGRGKQADAGPSARRSFEAAAINRMTESWLATANSIDQDLRGNLDRLRARSRDLAQNNDYVRKFLNMVARNVVGPNGFALQVRAMDGPGQPDRLANQTIETHFAAWGRMGVCEVSGRMSFTDLCRAAVRAVARDGEALLIEAEGGAAANDYGYALQLLDIARLDTRLNRAAVKGRNAIRMGVEIDSVQRPVAYWILTSNPGDGIYTQGQRHQRVTADRVIHLFLPDRVEQTRGFPWLHTAMLRLHHLKGYEEAAIIASRVGAAKMGWWVSPDGNPPVGEEDPATGDFITDAEPGSFDVAPTGYDLRTFDPAYPHAQYEMFVRACLRGLSSGLDVSYHSLANDLENVNYSSVRSGVLEERDQWMTLQGWFIEAFLRRVYERWLEQALLKGALTMPNGSALPLRKRDKWRVHQWQGRRWSWVDPLKDTQAAVVAIQNGLKSRRAVAAEQGVDIEEVFTQLAVEAALAAEHGIDVSGGPGTQHSNKGGPAQ